MRFAKPPTSTVLASLYWLGFGQWWIVEGAARADFHLIAIGLLNIVAAIAAYMDVRLFKWPIAVALLYASLSIVFGHGLTLWSALFAAINCPIGFLAIDWEAQPAIQDEEPAEDLRTPANIVVYLCILLGPALLLKFLTLDQLSGYWLHLFTAIITLMTCEQLRADNARNSIRGQIDGRILVRATLAWAPILLLLLPGILLAITFDTLLGNAVQYAEFKTVEIHSLTQDQRSFMMASMEERVYRWWWPPDLVQEHIDGWHLSLLERVETLQESASFWLRSVFACIHTSVRGLQIMSMIILSYVVTRSFLLVLFRVWLRQGGGEITFRLAYKARDAVVVTATALPEGGSES